MAKITTKKLAKNVIFSITAQLISLITSFVLGFIVPKFIDGYQYSYWQTYILYVGYVGVLHFGLLDGLVLRYSQYDYEELDKAGMRSQFQLLLIFTSILTIASCTVSSFFLEGVSLWIVVLVSVGIVTKNIFTYTSYSFQLTNRISKYAILVIVQRAIYAVIVVILLALKVNNFIWYCVADLAGDVLGVLLGSIFNRGMYFGKSLLPKDCLKEAWLNISAGIFLMIANLTASLLIGGAKMVIQWRWDELVFGKAAFSFSVSNLFLTFVSAISVVLFPSLKRMSEEELPDLYFKIRNAISPILFFVMIAYFPGCRILYKWLPDYAESLPYLGILLPIIVFSSKVSLLTNNYLKAYRREKLMLVINVASVVLGLGLFVLAAYGFSNLDLVLYFAVFSVTARSIASEIAVTKIIKKFNLRCIFDFIAEIIMTVAFVLIARYLTIWWGCLAYFGTLVVYVLVYRKTLLSSLKSVKALRKKSDKNKSAAIDDTNTDT